MFKPSIRMGKTRVLSDFECGMVVGARITGLSISETAVLLGFSLPKVYRKLSEKDRMTSDRQLRINCLGDVRGQRSMGRLV